MSPQAVALAVLFVRVAAAYVDWFVPAYADEVVAEYADWFDFQNVYKSLSPPLKNVPPNSLKISAKLKIFIALSTFCLRLW